MSWSTITLQIVRTLINDLDSTNYTNQRLAGIVTVAAQLVYNTMDFDYSYDIDVVNSTITPDPTDYKDEIFVNLVCIKAACIILGSESKTLAAQSFRVTDGPSSIDVSSAYKATKDLYDDLCGKYEKMVMDYRAGNSRAGEAILTPYTQDGLSGNPLRNFV